MTRTVPFHDSLYRLGQVGPALGVQLVRLVEVVANNRYTAMPIEFASDGSTQQAEEDTLTVTNLAEPADQTGQVPADTEAVALDVEGRWIVFLKPQPAPSAARPRSPPRSSSRWATAAYSVLEQVVHRRRHLHRQERRRGRHRPQPGRAVPGARGRPWTTARSSW